MEGDNTRRGSENVKQQTFSAYLGVSVMRRDVAKWCQADRLEECISSSYFRQCPPPHLSDIAPHRERCCSARCSCRAGCFRSSCSIEQQQQASKGAIGDPSQLLYWASHGRPILSARRPQLLLLKSFFLPSKGSVHSV